MSCDTRTRTSSSSTGSLTCQTRSFSATSSPQASGWSRDSAPGSVQTSSVTVELLIVKRNSPVLVALPEQLRLDRHGGPHRLGAGPLGEPEPAHAGPPPGPALR